jgi:uncharacterized RDD family membrane protein YckC
LVATKAGDCSVDGSRSALIVASDDYTDPGLRRLRAPASDAQALAGVLRDPGIGGFEVRTLLNEPAYEVNEAVEEFFADRRPDDLLLLHFSCHGVKDEGGELYFAAANTKLRRLGATAVAAEFVNRRMNRSRSRRVVLLLDCCYAGAFERGMTARAGTGMAIEEQFGGRGRAVITASSAMEYAFEGDQLADTQELAPSVFTSALVEGLETGEADRDQDGMVALDELYDYIHDKVQAATPNQTPGKWTFGVQGDLYIARRARPVTTPAPLPPELQQAMDHPLAAVRAGAVQELGRLLESRHAGLALAGRLALERLTEDDSRAVSAAASAALGAQAQPVSPEPVSPEPVSPEPVPPEPVPPRLDLSATVVDFVRIPQHSKSPERRVRLGNAGGGTLNARASARPTWLELRQVGDELVIGVDTTAAGEHDGVVTIESDGGSATIRVTATVDPHPTPAPAAQPPTAAVSQPPTAGQTTTDRGEPPPAWPHPPPEHPTRGRPRPRQDASPELGGDPRGSYQGDKLATWSQRVGAALIDLLAAAPGLILLFWGLDLLGGYDASAYGPGTAMAWIGLLYALLIIAYNRWRLQGRTGQSWGKRVLNLKLVRMADKTPIGGRMAFVRDLANLVDIWPLFGVGFLFPLWTVRRQTLPDKVMKTVVLSQGKTGSSASQTS